MVHSLMLRVDKLEKENENLKEERDDYCNYFRESQKEIKGLESKNRRLESYIKGVGSEGKGMFLDLDTTLGAIIKFIEEKK